MNRLSNIQHSFVQFIPERLEPGVLYISRRYRTASHLCCCGCGLEVVTPLNDAKWSISEREGQVWLRPSVGNWSFPCQSHYWIEGGRVVWARAMSRSSIAAVRKRDLRDAELLARQRPGLVMRLRNGTARLWSEVVRWFVRSR